MSKFTGRFGFSLIALNTFIVFAQERTQQSNPLVGLIGLVIGVLSLVSLWVIFQKAGKPGWAAIIPIYNIVVLLEIIGKPLWWVFMFFIPFVNIVFAFMTYYALGKRFGKSDGFCIGLVLLSFIFLPMLAFGDAKYQGASATA